MATPVEMAQAELASRELARRELSRRGGDSIGPDTPSKPTQLDETGAPLDNPDTIVAARRMNRPDLLQEAMTKAQQVPSMNPLENMKQQGSALLTDVGAIHQKLESGLANLVNATAPGNKVKGSGTNMEIGDVLASRGVPEPAASLGGLILDPTNLVTGAGAAVDTLSGVANQVRSALTKGAIKASIPQTARVLFNKPVAETQYLVNNPEALTEANIQPEAPQRLANSIALRISAVKHQGTQLYKKAADNITDAPIDAKTSQTLVTALSDILGQEGDVAHQDKILNLPVGKAVKEPTAINATRMKQTYEPGFGFDKEGNVTYQPKITTQTTKSENLGSVKSSETTHDLQTPGGPLTTKIVKTSEATVGKPDTYAPTTLRDLLNTASQGGDITTKQLVSLRNGLQSLRGGSGTSGRMSDTVLDTLGQIDPTFKEAASKWQDFKRAEEQSQHLFGGIVTDYGAAQRKAKVQAVTGAGNQLSSIFLNPESPMSRAPAELDAIFNRNLAKPTNYTKKVQDVAAAAGMNDIRPRLFGSTIGGSVQAAASPAVAMYGGNAAPLAILPLLAGGLGAPRVNTAIIRTLASKKILSASNVRWLNSPAGKFMQTAGQAGKAAKDNAYRNAVVRQLGGTNDTPPNSGDQQ